jgi:hypothetical protein
LLGRDADIAVGRGDARPAERPVIVGPRAGGNDR